MSASGTSSMNSNSNIPSISDPVKRPSTTDIGPSAKRSKEQLMEETVISEQENETNENSESPSKGNISEELIKISVEKQLKLAEQLVYKDADCQKLKKRFEEVDGNCRKWHDFALSLQSRIKKMAFILQRQQDTLKILYNKNVAHVSTQTEIFPNGVLNELKTNSTNVSLNHTGSRHIKQENIPGRKQRQNFAVAIKHEPLNSSSSYVIDLTSEEILASGNPGLSSKETPDMTTVYNSVPVKQSDVSRNVKYPDTATKALLKPAQPKRNHASPQIASPRHAQEAYVAHIRSDLTNGINALPRSSVNSVSPSRHKSSNSVVGMKLPYKQECKNGILVKKAPYTSPYPPLPEASLPSNHVLTSLPGPPPPILKIKKSKEGIELSWNHGNPDHANMDSYELYVYQHNPKNNAVNRWKRIGNDRIKAMPLPMACTLSQFSSGSVYYFAVRGRDVYERYGSFSLPCCSSEIQS